MARRDPNPESGGQTHGLSIRHRSPLIRVATAVLIAIVLGVFVYSLVDAWNATGGELPSVGRLAAGVALWVVGLVSAGYAWATLLGGDHRIEHGSALIVSQLGKYVPGGVFQATGQLALARSTGVSIRRGATAYSVLAVCQVAAGCAFIPLLAITWTRPPTVARILLGAAPLASLLLVDRRWMVWALHKIPRTRDTSDALVPRQALIVRAWLACIVTLGLTTLAYFVLLGSYGPVDRPALVIAAYATAWIVGFVVVPIPSGFGLREAVLVGILNGVYPASVIVATSVYHRLTTIAAEGIMALVVSHRLRPARLAAVRAAADPDDTDDATGIGDAADPDAERP